MANSFKTRGSLDILTFTSAPSIGGFEEEVMTLTGFLATDTILSVCQKTPDSNLTSLVGYSTPINDGLTAIYPIPISSGAIIVVTVMR